MTGADARAFGGPSTSQALFSKYQKPTKIRIFDTAVHAAGVAARAIVSGAGESARGFLGHHLEKRSVALHVMDATADHLWLQWWADRYWSRKTRRCRERAASGAQALDMKRCSELVFCRFNPPAAAAPATLAKFAAIRRASSRVSRFGRRATRRSNMSKSGRSGSARLALETTLMTPNRPSSVGSYLGPSLASCFLISGLSYKTTFNSELRISSFPLYSI